MRGLDLGSNVKGLRLRGRGQGAKTEGVWAPAEAKGRAWQKAGALACGENQDWGWVLGAYKGWGDQIWLEVWLRARLVA